MHMYNIRGPQMLFLKSTNNAAVYCFIRFSIVLSLLTINHYLIHQIQIKLWLILMIDPAIDLPIDRA